MPWHGKKRWHARKRMLKVSRKSVKTAQNPHRSRLDRHILNVVNGQGFIRANHVFGTFLNSSDTSYRAGITLIAPFVESSPTNGGTMSWPVPIDPGDATPGINEFLAPKAFFRKIISKFWFRPGDQNAPVDPASFFFRMPVGGFKIVVFRPRGNTFSLASGLDALSLNPGVFPRNWRAPFSPEFLSVY